MINYNFEYKFRLANSFGKLCRTKYVNGTVKQNHLCLQIIIKNIILCIMFYIKLSNIIAI